MTDQTSPTTAAAPPVREVEVHTDAPSRMTKYLADLAAAGFVVAALKPIAADKALSAKIEIRPGPMASSEVDVAKLMTITDDCVRAIAIDTSRYPLQRRDAKDDRRTIIVLPVDACASRRRPAYAGLSHDRWLVYVQCDDRDIGQAFVDKLLAKGYRAYRRGLTAIDDGFSVTHPEDADGLAFAETLRRMVELEIKAAAGADERLYGLVFKAAEVDTVTVTLPVDALKRGDLLASLKSASRFSCTIYSATSVAAAANALKDRLAPLHWRALQVRHDREMAGARIAYGGAPLPLLQRLQAAIAEDFPDLKLEMEKRWRSDDRDVWIFMPAGLAAPAAPEVDQPAPVAPAICDRSFIEVRDDSVAIGRHELPRRTHDPRAPNPASLARYVVDQTTAEVLEHVAASVAAAEPCLLEGATATSKTSAIVYLATLLRQPVVRLNMNAHTDAGELIGRHVPSGSGWRWQDGAVVLAMLRGDWLVLDELNLGDPATVERMNPVLESPPSLLVSEGDGRMIGGAGGEQADPRFRIFATINPVEGYVGRSPLSPAFKDRFVGFRRTRLATEEDVRDLLVYLLDGRHPPVVVEGVRYKGASATHAPPFVDLARRIPQNGTLVEALARFHVGAAAICDGAEDLADRPVITRRALLALVARLAALPDKPEPDWPGQVWAGIERYYLARAAGTGMYRSLVELAGAVGLRRDGWGRP